MTVSMSLRRLSVPVLIGFGLAAIPTAVRGQATEERVYATVMDDAGAPVAGLAVTDVTVRENGLAREVLRVSPATGRLRIAVLVDNSQASDSFITDYRAGLKAFFTEMGDGHEIALVTFAERPTLVVDYARDAQALLEGAGRIFAQTSSASYLMDAVVEISQGMQKREAGRRTLVVVSAEGPEFSNRFHQDVLDELRETGATLHAITMGVPSYVGADRERERSFTLDRGTLLTGGRQDNLRTSSSLPAVMRALAVELKSQYEIVYARPPALIPPESIAVEVGRPDLVVRATRLLPSP